MGWEGAEDDRMVSWKEVWPEEATLARALLQLDLAAMMGGPAFRPHVDACIQAIQSMLHGCTCAFPHPSQSSMQAGSHPLTTLRRDEASQPTLQDCSLVLNAPPWPIQPRGPTATVPMMLPHLDNSAQQPSLCEQRQHGKTGSLNAAHPSWPPAVVASEPGTATLQGNDSARSMHLHGSGSHMDSNEELTTVDPATMLSKASQPHGPPVCKATQPDADEPSATSAGGACPVQDDSMADGLGDAARKRRRVSQLGSPDRDLPAGRQEAGSGAAASGLDTWPVCSQGVPLPEGSLSGIVRHGLPVLHLPSFER